MKIIVNQTGGDFVQTCLEVNKAFNICRYYYCNLRSIVQKVESIPYYRTHNKIFLRFSYANIKGEIMSDDSKPAKTLDCIGLYCPQPLFQTREQIDAIQVGEILEVLSDDPAAEEDLKRFAKRTGNEIIRFENQDGVLRFWIKKFK
jgi:tRNA 2-thiouridine synthesizing protein A